MGVKVPLSHQTLDNWVKEHNIAMVNLIIPCDVLISMINFCQLTQPW